MMIYRVEVLGCKVNQYEAEQIRTMLADAGGAESDSVGDADLVVIHSCAVTMAAVGKVRRSIRKASESSPQASIFVTGCAAKHGIVDRDLKDFVYIEPGAGWLRRLEQALVRSGLGSVARSGRNGDILRLDRFSGHKRAFLKIQDGCDIHCSYCIVPKLRGTSRDKPLAEIVAEAEMLADAGHREIVVTGVNVGLYGRRTGISLAHIMDRLARIRGVDRLRLSSLHPSDLNDELLAVWRRSGKLMPHIHLPLQSGSDAVLAAMRRGYTGAEFMSAVERARDRLDQPAITTDVIVGFPGETETDYRQTEAVSKAVGFSRMHIFPFSPRPGTSAASLSRSDRPEEIKNRLRKLRTLASELRERFHRDIVGRPSSMLIESFEEDRQVCRGYTERYVPATLPGRPDDVGKVVEVAIQSATSTGVRVRLCSDQTTP